MDRNLDISRNLNVRIDKNHFFNMIQFWPKKRNFLECPEITKIRLKNYSLFSLKIRVTKNPVFFFNKKNLSWKYKLYSKIFFIRFSLFKEFFLPFRQSNHSIWVLSDQLETGILRIFMVHHGRPLEFVKLKRLRAS